MEDNSTRASSIWYSFIYLTFNNPTIVHSCELDVIYLIWQRWMFENWEDQSLAVMLIKIEQWQSIENRKNIIYTFSLATFKLQVPFLWDELGVLENF